MKMKRRSTPAPHIPFISLADIAWQLIIFFLVAATFTANQAMKVDIPNTSDQAKNAPQSDKSLTIIAGETSLTLDGQPVLLPQLSEEIARKLKGKKTDQERAVVVEGRDDLSFQRDIDVMYAVQKAGGVLMMAEEQ